ncbi:glycosyltransferase family 2 protein [Chitinophaga arvensicola]|uniref:Glycosyltransferase involved in cell wall bisynthesis n=1 Tax=Chitinophaga arvensicola TaxID=29529 RepID=A0A1I0S7Y0_9BACT|nr:glycosyltransferase [Chitinophaga arvensicola]SEW51976.1 Glycosyltransferase involved in cell wall bisynthesis [Chitinophaga arvensicola]
MPEPLVSIIVPVYNLAPYLPACIDSLLQQTYAPLEIILINDASTDSSLEVLQNYQQQHPRLQVYSQPNAGPGPARNNGIDRATGEYIVFLDGDDWFAPETVADCMETALREDADIVCFGYRQITHQDGQEKELYRFEYDPAFYTDNDNIAGALGENGHNPSKLNTATMGKLYRTSLLNENNIRFRLSIFEDSPFMLEAVFYASRIRAVKGALYNYLLRDKSLAEKSITTGTLSAEKLQHFYAADQLIKEFLIAKNIFARYEALYHSFHNGRVLLYGGYLDVYGKGENRYAASWAIFIAVLKEHRHSITPDRKGLYRGYRKRVVPLYWGAKLSAISQRAAHRFFRIYEQMLAP